MNATFAVNRLLAEIVSIAEPDLIEQIEPVRLGREQVLHDPDDVQRNIYFPSSCLVSLMHVMESGSCAETALVGNDGVIGVALVMGGDSMPLRAQVQVEGHAYRLRSALLKRALLEQPAMQQLFLRYAQALLTQMGQVAACNRHHSLDQQFCRRLLMSADRLPQGELQMTQESIAQRLGVRRESVTLAAQKLHRVGAIRYSRGRIKILDRHQLETQVCECYGVIGREVRRLHERTVVGARLIVDKVGSRTDVDVGGNHCAGVIASENERHVPGNSNERRSGLDRRQLEDRRRNVIAIAFPDRRRPGGGRRDGNR